MRTIFLPGGQYTRVPYNALMKNRISVLFVCTGNSARSIMAEAIANQRFGHRLRASSAGSAPRGAVHPLAVQTLSRNGLSARGLRSKGLEHFTGEPFDLVVTLCDQARGEPCPVFADDPPREHWSMPDPAAAPDGAAAFAGVFEALAERIERLSLSSPHARSDH